MENRKPERKTRVSKEKQPGKPGKSAAEGIRLNRYIAHCGICSRREADELILEGAITVNGKKVTDLGTKVRPGDVVKYRDKVLTAEKKVMKNKTIAWEKIRDRNEAFDMRKYALAGLELLQIDLNELAKIDRSNLTKLFSKNKSKERKRILSKGVSSE